MQTIKLQIKGMHCGGCAEIIRHVLEGEPGVQGCSVSHEESRARIAIDSARVSGEQLAEAVRRAGYDATVLTE